MDELKACPGSWTLYLEREALALGLEVTSQGQNLLEENSYLLFPLVPPGASVLISLLKVTCRWLPLTPQVKLHSLHA